MLRSKPSKLWCWLHLLRSNLPDFQPSWKSKMELSVEYSCPLPQTKTTIYNWWGQTNTKYALMGGDRLTQKRLPKAWIWIFKFGWRVGGGWPSDYSTTSWSNLHLARFQAKLKFPSWTDCGKILKRNMSLWNWCWLPLH